MDRSTKCADKKQCWCCLLSMFQVTVSLKSKKEKWGSKNYPRLIGQSPDPVQVGPDGPAPSGPSLVQLPAAPWPLRCSCRLLPSSGQRLDYLQGQGRLMRPHRDVSFEYILRGARQYSRTVGVLAGSLPLGWALLKPALLFLARPPWCHAGLPGLVSLQYSWLRRHSPASAHDEVRTGYAFQPCWVIIV